MKRTELARGAGLTRTSSLAPGRVPPAERQENRDGRTRPRAERLAGRKPAGNPIPAAARAAVLERDGMACVRCGISVAHGPRSIHHRQPRGMGGTALAGAHAMSLLVLVCGTGTTGCHGWIESKRAEARDLGWLISKFEPADPQTVPLRWAATDHRLWLLDDGTRTTACDAPTS